MLRLIIKFKKTKKGQDIIDNIVAMGIFTIAFLYVVYSTVSTIAPILETEEYIDVQLTAFTTIEKVISDPTYGLASRDHVISYDKLVEFLSKEDTAKYPFCPLNKSQNSYIKLLDSLGLIDTNNNLAKYNLQFVITSTYVKVQTLANVSQLDIDDFNYSLPNGYSVSDKIFYNTDKAYLGNNSYEFLVLRGNRGEDYNRVYIDINFNKNFQDEVDRGFYGYDGVTPKSGLAKNDDFNLSSQKYILTEVYKDGSGLEILNIDAADIILGYRRGYSDIVLVISRLVLIDEFGELKEKVITLIMWEGNRFPC